MPYKTPDIENKLANKFGFTRSQHKGDDHIRYELKLDGLPIIQTHFSHGSKESEKLVGIIARQVRVRKPFFDGMIECSNSKEAYYEMIRKDPYPPFEPYLIKK